MFIRLIVLAAAPGGFRDFELLIPILKTRSALRPSTGMPDIEALMAGGTIGRVSATTHCTLGAVGAALSHVALWSKAIEERQSITICEDDAIFNVGYAQSPQSLIDALPADWDFILWGWNFDANLLIDLIPAYRLACAGSTGAR